MKINYAQGSIGVAAPIPTYAGWDSIGIGTGFLQCVKQEVADDSNLLLSDLDMKPGVRGLLTMVIINMVSHVM